LEPYQSRKVRRQDEMQLFQSNEEYFKAVEDLIARLQSGGHRQAADELRDGYRSLNGLTDGWALFLESLEKVKAAYSGRFDREDREMLETIRQSTHKAVYRR
jgi:hypothetical protein